MAKVVFTNGCFDLLHIGHVRFLQACRALGDSLVVGINSDSSVRNLKGFGRPVITQEDRKAMLLELRSVDEVVIFDDLDPLRTIELLKPDVLAKGADWPLEKIIGADFVVARGGRVVQVPLLDGFSTTRIIHKIMALEGY